MSWSTPVLSRLCKEDDVVCYICTYIHYEHGKERKVLLLFSALRCDSFPCLSLSCPLALHRACWFFIFSFNYSSGLRQGKVVRSFPFCYEHLTWVLIKRLFCSILYTHTHSLSLSVCVCVFSHSLRASLPPRGSQGPKDLVHGLVGQLNAEEGRGIGGHGARQGRAEAREEGLEAAPGVEVADGATESDVAVSGLET